MIAKFEFKVTVHYSLWAKCTQLWPLNSILFEKKFCRNNTTFQKILISFVLSVVRNILYNPGNYVIIFYDI